MPIKHLDIPEATLIKLAEVHEPYRHRLSDRKLLVEAIDFAATDAARCRDESVKLTEGDRQLLDDLVHFGMYKSYETAVKEALKLLREKKAPELTAAVEKRYGITDGN